MVGAITRLLKAKFHKQADFGIIQCYRKAPQTNKSAIQALPTHPQPHFRPAPTQHPGLQGLDLLPLFTFQLQ